MPLGRIFTRFFIVGACLLHSPQAQALSLCGALCSCTVSTSTMAFGGYNPINNTSVAVSTSLTVNCQLLSGLVSLLVPYTVSLSKGQSGTYTSRQMAGPSSNKLNYNLYSNAAMTTIWGDGTGGSQTTSNTITVTLLGVSVGQTQTIYGLVPAGQNVKLGSYTDTITATVNY